MDTLEEVYPAVTRFEVIDQNGRTYTHQTVGVIEFSIQDSGRTLKVFLSPQREDP